jgi:hypothetical protein
LLPERALVYRTVDRVIVRRENVERGVVDRRTRFAFHFGLNLVFHLNFYIRHLDEEYSGVFSSLFWMGRCLWELFTAFFDMNLESKVEQRRRFLFLSKVVSSDSRFILKLSKQGLQPSRWVIRTYLVHSPAETIVGHDRMSCISIVQQHLFCFLS